MKIRTEKHIGPNGVEWTAIDDDSYDGPGSPMGWGATENEAIADLQDQIERDNVASMDEWLKAKRS